MKFQPGHKLAKGRPKGVPNKMTRSAKEAFQLAFDGMGGWEGLMKWAADAKTPQNRATFYQLYARMIPMEVATDPNNPLAITITREVIAKG